MFMVLPRGKLFFGYTDRELMDRSGYDLVHTDDLAYFAAAHQECKLWLAYRHCALHS